MNIAEWILVVILAVTLFIFLVTAIVLTIRLIKLADEASKIVATGQGIAAKADDIVDNVKGMTSVGGIVKTFASRVMENQERRYAEEDAARDEAKEAEEARHEAEEKAVREAIRRAETGSTARSTARASHAGSASRSNSRAKSTPKTPTSRTKKTSLGARLKKQK